MNVDQTLAGRLGRTETSSLADMRRMAAQYAPSALTAAQYATSSAWIAAQYAPSALTAAQYATSAALMAAQHAPSFLMAAECVAFSVLVVPPAPPASQFCTLPKSC